MEGKIRAGINVCELCEPKGRQTHAIVPHSAFFSLSEMLALQFDVVLADHTCVERLLVEG